MKIAYLANVRFPSERAHAAQIAHMSQAFVQSGASVDLVVNKRVTSDKIAIDSYFKIDSTFKVIRIPGGFFSPKIKASFYFSELFFTLSFLYLCKSKSYDILYARSEWIVWVLSIFVSVEKLIWESHEAKLNFPARRILHKGIKTVVISEGIHESYIKYGVPTEQILVAHDGIDESFFGAVETKEQARARLGISAGEKVAMYIGGFDEWKGIETFLKASELSLEVLFVAIGGDQKQINNFANQYTKVLFLGSRPYAELKDNQQAADILVIPNSATSALSEKYTSPLKLFAHLASGIPIIASNIPSITNVTGHDTVTLCIPDNSQSLNNTTEEVFSDYENKTHQAQAIKAQSIRYTWTNRATQILSFYTKS